MILLGFQESNNTIFEDKYQFTDVSEMVFAMIENKKSGIMRANVREFKHTETYDGPTRNGMMLRINSVEDIERYQKWFNDFFDKMRESV